MAKRKSCDGCKYSIDRNTCEALYMKEYNKPCGSPESIVEMIRAGFNKDTAESLKKAMEVFRLSENPKYIKLGKEIVETFGDITAMGFNRFHPLPKNPAEIDRYVQTSIYFGMLQGVCFHLALMEYITNKKEAMKNKTTKL